MLPVASIPGVLRACRQHLQSCSQGRAGRYTGLLHHSLRLLPTTQGRSWSPPIGIQRDTLPLGCLPAPLGTRNPLCSKQIILGLGKGRRGIAGQRKRLTWCHTENILASGTAAPEDCSSGPSTHQAESSCGIVQLMQTRQFISSHRWEHTVLQPWHEQQWDIHFKMWLAMCHELAAPLKHPYQARKRADIPLHKVAMHVALQGVHGPHRRTSMQDTYTAWRNRSCQTVMAGVIFPHAANENPDWEQWRDT